MHPDCVFAQYRFENDFGAEVVKMKGEYPYWVGLLRWYGNNKMNYFREWIDKELGLLNGVAEIKDPHEVDALLEKIEALND